ncbi:RNA-directed DNA polymerase [Aliiroseovarius crassostreae]|uniref:RNA-directed DNA polymerase n=1 Tax=Aliiroseovarius crassostreae TaxID=154981 RepID=A0A9Q9HFS5_9RHOB|nr:RNA-directed DNA polymerase [Aliiroseovarius crassostreae]UWP96500.1 RNA-directed DNA polymerase [Aliiroseovarius crassostreae]
MRPILQSPKFQFLQSDIKDVFDISLLKEEWKKRTKPQIRKQLVFDAIEYRDIDHDLSRLLHRVRREVSEGNYVVQMPKRYLTEKSRGLCRQMTLIHPRDLLVLERLSRSVYFELKNKAPSKSAFFEPDDGKFAKGFKQSDFEYGSFASWKKFQKSIFGFAKENNYIVITDVANFYDFINFQHLRNIVSSLADIRESTLDLLIHVLNRLTWTPDFMPLTQVGMPQIETSATRVLANAMLYEVDKLCEHSAVSNYARFMDDMDVGVDSVEKAKVIVRDMDLTLQSRQLRLNSSKTQILSQQEAFSHFCIAENMTLSRIEALVEKKRFPSFTKTILTSKYEMWLDRSTDGGPGENSRFTKGNGPKIHKHILSLLYDAGGTVSDEDLLWQIENNPSMRPTALRYLSKTGRGNTVLKRLVSMAKNGVFVDDAAYVDVAGFMLHTRFRKTNACTLRVEEFCKLAASTSDIGLHSAIFVSARFLTRPQIQSLLDDHIEQISGDFWLCRAAGGLTSLFIGEAEWGLYLEFLRNLNSPDADDVYNYLLSVSSATSFNQSLKAYIKAANHTFPQGLFFPKVLILLAVAKNGDCAALAPNLHTDHPALKKDPYYAQMGF